MDTSLNSIQKILLKLSLESLATGKASWLAPGGRSCSPPRIPPSKCLVIAHRGDTKVAIENTLPAVESALKMGVDGIEVDLQLTRDGHIVVFHDADMRRLAGSPECVEKTNLASLKKISLGNSKIATLEELLDLVGDTALLNLEIKTVSYRHAAIEKKIIAALKSFHLNESILISSFHPLPLWRLKKMAPGLARGYLFQNKLRLHRKIFPWVAPFSINAPVAYASPSLVHETHARGRRFFVWTVNHEDVMACCIRMGADGLITDEPKKLMRILSQK